MVVAAKLQLAPSDASPEKIIWAAIKNILGNVAAFANVYTVSDRAETLALVDFADITHKGITDTNFTANNVDEVNATNTIKTDAQEIGVGVSIGIEAGVAVWNNELHGTARALVKDSKIGTNNQQRANLKVLSLNDIKNDFTAVNVGVGAITVGANIVTENMNTTALAEVVGSNNEKIYARDVQILAKENAKVTDAVYPISLSLVTAAGTKVRINLGNENTIGYTITKPSSNDTDDNGYGLLFNNPDASGDITDPTGTDNDETKTYGGTSGNDDIGKDIDEVAKGVLTKHTTTSSGTVTEKGILAKVSGVEINASGNIEVGTDVQDTVDSSVLSVQALGVKGAGITNFITTDQNIGITVNNATLTGKKVEIVNKTDGKISAKATPVRANAAELASVNEAFVERRDKVNITVDSSTLTATGTNEELLIRNKDTRSLKAEILSPGFDVFSAGYLSAEVTDKSNFSLKIDSTGSNSKLNGTKITLDNFKEKKTTENKYNLSATVGFYGFDGIDGRGTLAQSTLNSTATLSIKDGVAFKGDDIDITNGFQDIALNANEDFGTVGALNVEINKSRVNSTAKADTQIGKIVVDGYTEGKRADLSVKSVSDICFNDVIGGVTATAANLGGTNYVRNTIDNKATLKFDANNLKVHDLDLTAHTEQTGTMETNAYSGSALAITPLAAGVKNDANFISELLLSGDITASGNVTVGANHDTDSKIACVGWGGAILGGSGNGIRTYTDVLNVTELYYATITTDGNLNVLTTTNFNQNKGVADPTKTGTKDALHSNYMMYGSMKGVGVAGLSNSIDSKVTIGNETLIGGSFAKNANGNFTKDANGKLIANKTQAKLKSGGKMIVGGYSHNIINVGESATASAAVAGGITSTIRNTITDNTNVQIVENDGNAYDTELRTTNGKQDLYIVAYDNIDSSTVGFSEYITLGIGGAGCYVYDTTTRNNTIDIGGGVDIISLGNLNLYTSRDENGKVSEYSVLQASRAFAASVITIPYTSIHSNLTQNNHITVQKDAELFSVKDTNIAADKGYEKIDRETGSYCWYKNNYGDERVTTSKGNIGNNITDTNYVQVDGHVTAGVLNKIAVYIGKNNDGNIYVVVPDDGTADHITTTGNQVLVVADYEAKDGKYYLYDSGATKGHGTEISADFINFGFEAYTEGGHIYTVQEQEEEFFRITGIKRTDFSAQSVELGRQTLSQLEQLDKLLNEYGADKGPAYYNLQAERNRLYNLAKSMGLLSDDPSSASLSGVNLAINLPNLYGQGGNVDIATSDLKGTDTGKITAKGQASINILNNSSMLLQVNDVVIDHSGGRVYYNNEALLEGTYATRIGEINKTAKTGFAAQVVTKEGTVPGINITGTWAGVVHFNEYTFENDQHVNVTAPACDMKVPSHIYVVGEVVNKAGVVNIGTKEGDIVVSGERATVNGATVTIYSDTGRIFENDANGLINIGGAPEILNEDSSDASYRKYFDEFVTAYNSDAGRKVMAALKGQGDMDSELSGYGGCKTIVTGAEAYALGIVNEEDKDADKVSIDFGFEIPKVIIYKKDTETVQWNSRRIQFGRESDASKRNVYLNLNNIPGVVRKDGDKPLSGRITGADIVLSAADINVNGIIQSGFGEYRLNLTAADEARIQAIKNSIGSGEVKLADKDVLNNPRYLIREGGAVWDSASQSYVYEIGAYYNPSTDTVVTSRVDANGGHIFLNGRISSTGDGMIKCLDGVYNITVKNAFDHNLALNDLVVNDVQGSITIVDSGLGKAVEITRSGGVKPLQYGGTTGDTSQITANGSGYTYQPKGGLTYEWVNGTKQDTEVYYYEDRRATWWGWSDYKPYSTSPEETTIIDPYKPEKTFGERPRLDGSFIVDEGTSLGNELEMTRYLTKVEADDVWTQDGDPTTYTTGLYGCHKWMRFHWKKNKGLYYTNQAKVRADNKIDISFLGTAAENGKVDIINAAATDKNILIYGNIGNQQLYTSAAGGEEKGRVSINSSGAILDKNGLLFGGTVELQSNGDMENIGIMAGNAVKLDAWSNNGMGNLTIDVKNQATALGKVELGWLGNKNAVNNNVVDAVTLTAQGDIVRADGNPLVWADKISLTSANGAVGEANRYLEVRGGQYPVTTDSMSASVSVLANNNIYIEQDKGNLRVGTIWSNNGDVNVRVPDGAVTDALSGAKIVESTQQDLISKWVSLGLIDDGSDEAKTKIQQKNERLQAERNALIAERDYKGTPEARKAEINTELTNMDAEKTAKFSEFAEIRTHFVELKTAEEAKASPDAAKIEDYEKQIAKVDSQKTAYEANYNTLRNSLIAERDKPATTPERIAKINAQLAEMPTKYTPWNADMLLYALQDSIFNPDAGTEASKTDPNFYGKNINLQVKNTVGIRSDAVETYRLDYLYAKDASGKLLHVDALRSVSSADPGTVEWDNTNKQVKVTSRVTVGLQQNKEGDNLGNLTVTGYNNGSVGDYVYMEGRKFLDNTKTNDVDLKVAAIKALGEVRLTSLGSILNGADAGKAAIITNNNLFLSAGEKDATDGFSLGSSATPLVIQAKGNTQLLATGDIYVKSLGNLNVLDVVAGRESYTNGGVISLTADRLEGNAGTGNIYGVYVAGQDVQGNIRSDGGKTITLKAAGSIGSWTDITKTIRFENVADTVASANCGIFLTADKEIVAEGISTEMASGTKNAEGKYQVNAGGKLVIGKMESTTAKKARITVNGNVEFNDNSVDFGLNNNSEIDVYGAGKLKVNGQVKAENVLLSGATGVQLEGGNAIGTKVTLQAGVVPTLTAGVVALVNSTDIANADVTNLDSSTAYSGGVQAVNLTVKAKRDIKLGLNTAKDNIKVDNADLDTKRDVVFEDASVSGLFLGATEAHVKVYNSLDTVAESCVEGTVKVGFNKADETLVTKNIGANGGIEITSAGDLRNEENCYIHNAGTGDISITADKGIINNNVISNTTGDITLTANDGDVITEDLVTTTGDITIIAEQEIINKNLINTSEGNIVLATNDDITNNGNVQTASGHVAFEAGEDLTNSGNISSTDGNVLLFAGNKILNTEANTSVEAGQNVIMFIADEGLENYGNIEAGTLTGTTQGSVVMGDFSDFNFGGTVATESFISAETFALIDSLLGEYADEIRGYESYGNFINTGNVVAHKGWVYFSTAGESMENSGVLLSQEGNVYLGCEGIITNSGAITAEDQNVAIAAEGIMNYATIEAQKSAFLLSTADIYNGEDIASATPSTDIHIYAGDDILFLTAEGLENKAKLTAGANITDGTKGHGGDIFLDDYEFLSTPDKLDDDTKGFLTYLVGGYWSGLVDYESNATIQNFGNITTYKGGSGKGLVHMDSQGMTENYGTIYSVDGEVFMDSTEDLVNHKDIFVINTTGTVSCNVTLQATGNIYNTGDINVKGKGKVLIDADSLDQAELTSAGITDVTTLTQAQIEAATYKKVSSIDLMDDDGNPTGTVLTYSGIYNTGNIYTSKGDVTFKSMYGGDIYNTDELADVDSSSATTVANGKITMNSPWGKITNTKALHASQDIEITSKSHIYNLSAVDGTTPAEVEGQSITRGLTSDNGHIKLTSTAGAIVNDGIIETKNGDIILTANGYVEYKRLKDEDGNGRINFADLKYGVTDADSKTYEELATEYFATDKGLIKAGIYNHTDSDYTANGGDITITSVYTIDASGSFTALKKDAYGTEHTGKGNITVTANGDSSGQNGDIYHYAHIGTKIARNGAVNYTEESYADGDLTYEMVRADGEIKYKAKNKAYLITDMIAEDGIKLTFDAGTTISKEIICLNGDVTIQTKGQSSSSSGDLLVSAKITSGGAVNLISAGNLKFDTTSGSAEINSKDDITLTAERDILVEDATKIMTEEGGLELTSNKGGIDVTGDIEAKDFVRLYTKGDNTEDRAGDYAERFDGDYTAPTGTPSDSIVSPGIKVAGDITTEGDLDIATYGDDVTVQNVKAGKMAAVGTSDGKVKIEGTIEGKNVALYSEKATAEIEFDKIKVEEKLVLAGNNWDLDMTNVDSGGNPFDLYVYGAIAADGTVNLGSSVKLDYRNGPTKDVRIRQLNAVNAEVHTDGALTIDNLSVANKAELYVMGTKTDVFGTMQAADADAQFIYYDPGQGGGAALDLSHVYFGYDLASRQNHIDALSADPTIFEKPAYNPDNCPVCAEEENASLAAGGGTGTIPGTGVGGTSGNRGRKFEQATAGKQRYAGVLLMNNFGYKSYAQRFSAEDLMTHLEDIKAVGQFDNYFNIGLGFFDRFNIIDIPDVTVNSITLNNTFRDSGIIVVRDDKKDDEYDF